MFGLVAETNTVFSLAVYSLGLAGSFVALAYYGVARTPASVSARVALNASHMEAFFRRVDPVRHGRSRDR